MKDHRIALLALGGTLWAFGIWVATGAELRVPGTSCCEARQHEEHDKTRHETFLVLERQLEVQPGGRLLMDVYYGDVRVAPGDGNEATVKVYARARDEEWGRSVVERMRFNIRADGGDLIVESDNPAIEDWEWRRHHGVGVEVRVTVPARFDLDVRSGDGDVWLGDVEGRISARTSDGDLQLGSLKGPEISVRTADGDVSAEALQAPAITLHTSDGDLHLRHVSGSLEASTGDGDVYLQLGTAQEARIRTGDGDVTVVAGPSLGFQLDARGETVSLGADLQLDGSRGAGWARGAVNGGGPLLSVRTSDGTVRLRTGG